MKINHDSISQFCAELGQDRLLVQGAGGNVSWKDGDTLWIKGSGAWLANAKVANIFVPVDLKKLISSLSRGDFSVTPQLITTSDLRPSIETILHALMPQKIVIHLHAINPLAYLVLQDAKIKIEEISRALPWKSAFIEYFKPGAKLAEAINVAMKAQNSIQICFLKNHGIVIGGDSILEVRSILGDLLKASSNMLGPKLIQNSSMLPEVPKEVDGVYRPIEDVDVQQLAQNALLFNRLHSDWVLYPDHAVFLGPKAFIFDDWDSFFMALHSFDLPPELVFIREKGVFVTRSFSLLKEIQLRCYLEILVRVSHEDIVCPLESGDVSELLDWDAEKIRQNLNLTRL